MNGGQAQPTLDYLIISSPIVRFILDLRTSVFKINFCLPSLSLESETSTHLVENPDFRQFLNKIISSHMTSREFSISLLDSLTLFQGASTTKLRDHEKS